MTHSTIVSTSQHFDKGTMTGMFEKIYDQAVLAAREGKPIHEVETEIHAEIRKLGNGILNAFVREVGPGDLGEAIELNDGTVVKRLSETKIRRYVSLLGELNIERHVYARRESQKIEFVPTDARLNLPQSEYSYPVQNFAQKLAVETPYAKVAETFRDLLHVRLTVDALERSNLGMSEYVEDFRNSRPCPGEEAEILVTQADGKGVPIIREVEVMEHFGEKKPGPKLGRKRVACVGCVYTVDPKCRTPEEVVDSLWGRNPWGGTVETVPRATNKRVIASLSRDLGEECELKAKDATYRWIDTQVDMRLGKRTEIVSVMDGDPYLLETSERHLRRDGVTVTQILDVLHVAGYLWTATHLFCEPGSREASDFMERRMLMLLEGNVGGIISGLRQMGTKWGLDGERLKKLEGVCGYLYRNRERMKYDEYLRRGLPIASGVIEGACRYVVKDRMERTGTRWSEKGAVSMLKLRTTKLNDDWDFYQEEFIGREKRKLYDDKFAINQVEWVVQA